jgi:hypothetical protein
MWGMRRRLGRRSKVRATEARVACVTQQNILFWKTAARQNNRNGRLSPFGLGRASLVRRRGYFCSVRKRTDFARWEPFRQWHDPAHLLVGIFACRQPKRFGAFLTQRGHSSGNVTLVAVKLTDAVPPRPNAKLSPQTTTPSTNERHHVSSSSKALACFKSRLSKPSVNQP